MDNITYLQNADYSSSLERTNQHKPADIYTSNLNVKERAYVEVQTPLVTPFPTLDDEEPKLKEVSWRYVPNRHSYFAFAIIVAVFFNCPLGILAAWMSVSSAKKRMNGEKYAAAKRAKLSLCISLLGIFISSITVVLLLYFYIHNNPK